MDEERLETIEAHLAEAAHLLGGVADASVPVVRALDSLRAAMVEMVAEWRAQNILSRPNSGT